MAGFLKVTTKIDGKAWWLGLHRDQLRVSMGSERYMYPLGLGLQVT